MSHQTREFLTFIWATATPFTVLGLVTAGVACTPDQQDAEPKVEITAVEVEEIPITTDSEAARQLFLEGQHYLDVARPVKAREKLRAGSLGSARCQRACNHLTTTPGPP